MAKLWKAIEIIMYFILCKVLHLKIDSNMWNRLYQFVRFGIVGLSNTLISYIVYMIFVLLGCHYLIASLLGFLVSIFNAYYWNSKYVFKADDGETRIYWKTFLKTFLSYAGTGLVLNNLLLILWVDIFNIQEMAGPVLNLFITIPLNFILNKNWAFKKK